MKVTPELQQYKDARDLLKLIRLRLSGQTSLLTYKRAAELLARGKNYSRPLAHACNLLDAAAALAGVPLLALITVLSSDEKINPEAFKREYGSRRQRIIDRSLRHSFSERDLKALEAALSDLGGRGDQKAWAYVVQLYPGDLLYLRLLGARTANISDAIHDIGTDTPELTTQLASTYVRDEKVRGAVLARAQGKCEFCQQLGFLKADGSRYLETHHILALANEGADRVTNVAALCANDHREAHFGERSGEIESALLAKLRDSYSTAK